MPGFLKRAEQKLLLNQPLIWSTRVHLVLYYGILYNLLLAGLCFVTPMEVLDRSEAGYWVGFTIIIAIIALTTWLIYLLRFNVFKKYGNIKPLHALLTFLLYFVSTGIIILSVFVYPAVECVRANNTIGDKELVQDVNNINIKICQLEQKLFNKPWVYDTVQASGSLKPISKPQYKDYEEPEVDAAAAGTFHHNYYIVDTVTFREKLAEADSVLKLNDSLYLVYKTPQLQFINVYELVTYTKDSVFTSFEIYNKAIKQPPSAAELPAIAKELEILKNKYKGSGFYYTEEVHTDDESYVVVRKKHHVNDLNDNIGHLTSKKYSFSGKHLSEMFRVFYYFTLAITLLIFIFRHTTVRTFFLSLLTGVLLSIFTALILSMTRGGDSTFLGWLIGYTLLFFIGSVFTFSMTKRSALSGININLFVFLIPILPLLVVDFIYRLKKEQYYQDYGTYYPPFINQYYLYAEIGGTVLLLVLLATYINKVYRRWYSLPEH
jgi:hypothetical protein